MHFRCALQGSYDGKVEQDLKGKGIRMGLWTENGLSHAAEEMGAGSRVVKTDVVWVGIE